MRFLLFSVFMGMLGVNHVFGQTFQEINSEDLLVLTGKSNDTTYVINFWATWCSPCVKEIHYFEELHRDDQLKNIKVILVSLDFPNQVDERLIPFLEAKKITASVMLMTDLNYNAWIDKVDPAWSGAIPATLIYNKENRIFLEKEVSRNELFEQVNQLLN